MSTKVRGVHSMKKKSKPNWDERFYLDSIPNYNAFQDPNYLSMTMLRQKIKFDETNRKYCATTSNRSKPFPVIDQKVSSEYHNKTNEDLWFPIKADQEAFNDQKAMIASLWKDLGVTDEYIAEFNQFLTTSINNKRTGMDFLKEILAMEKQSLIRLRDALNKLSKEIDKRETAIDFLRNLRLNTESDDGTKRREPSEAVMSDVLQAIKSIRIHSINTVNYMQKIREICSYSVLCGKFNLEHLNKAFGFDRDYMIQMKYDLNFLSNCSLRKYFNFAAENDPFLLNISDSENQGGNEYKTVPISEDMAEIIMKCRYIMFQDNMFFQLNSKKTQERRMITNARLGHTIEGINMSKLSKSLQLMKQGREYDKMFLQGNGKGRKIVIEREEISAMNTDELNRKIERYENKTKNRIIKDGGDLEESVDVNEKRDELSPEEMEKIIKEQEDEETRKRKEKEDEEERIRQEEQRIKEEEQERIRQEEQRIKEEEEERIRQEEQRIKEEEEERIRQEEEERIKQEEEERIRKEEDEKRKQEEEERIRQEEEERKRKNVIYYNSSLESLTSNLTSIQYYNQIPSFIKSSFNLTKSLFNHTSILSGISPRLLICTSIENEYCGICQVSYTKSLGSTKTKLTINHLSTSIPEDWESVFSAFLDFIKLNFAFHELYIKIWNKNNPEVIRFFMENQSFEMEHTEKVSDDQMIHELMFECDNNIKVEGDYCKSFEFATSTIISLINKDNKHDEDEDAHCNDKHINLFNVLFLMNHLKASSSYHFLFNSPNAQTDLFKNNPIIKCLQSTNSSSFPQFQNNISALLSLNEIPFDLNFFNHSDTSTVQSNVTLVNSLSFANTLTTVYNNHLYTRLSCLMGINQGEGMTMYYIPSSNDLSLIVFELTPGLKQKFNENKENIYTLFYKQFFSFEKVFEKKNEMKTLWMPSFEIDGHMSCKGIECLREVQMQKNGSDEEEETIGEIDDYLKVKWGNDVSKDMGFDVEPENGDIIIKDDFIVGVMNFYALETMKLPAVLLLQINKGQLSKKK